MTPADLSLYAWDKIRASATAIAAHWPSPVTHEDEDLAWAVHVMFGDDGAEAKLGMTFAQYHVHVVGCAAQYQARTAERAQRAAERDWAALQAAHGVRGYVVPLPAPRPRTRAPKRR